MTETTQQETGADDGQVAEHVDPPLTITHPGEVPDHHPHVYRALWALMRDVSWVPKTGQMDGRGGSGKYAFREIEQVLAALGSRARVHGLALQSRHVAGPEYAEHDIPKSSGSGSTRWTTCRGLVIEWSWTSLVDGSTVSAIGVGEGRDSSDKATNKAMTAAYKYALTQSTMLPTFDPDPDEDRPEVEDERPQQGRRGGRDGHGPQRGDDPAEEAADPSPVDVLTAIRQAKDIGTLTEIREWLARRDALGAEVEGQSFERHLEAARWVVDPDGAQAAQAERGEP